ncbi:MAG: hypothetical protein JXA97_12570 [Anaerolineales bacterium]|nr:hypothetical protein [Anaerolineales bacterium]
MRFRSERSVARMMDDASTYAKSLNHRRIKDVIPAYLEEISSARSALRTDTSTLSQRLMLLKKSQRHILEAKRLVDERRTRKAYLSMEDLTCLIRLRHYSMLAAIMLGVGMKDLRDGVQFPPRAA